MRGHNRLEVVQALLAIEGTLHSTLVFVVCPMLDLGDASPPCGPPPASRAYSQNPIEAAGAYIPAIVA